MATGRYVTSRENDGNINMLSTDGFFAFKKEGHEVSALARMAFYVNLSIG